MAVSDSGQAGATIEITPDMLQAGVSAIREMRIGQSLETIVDEVYFAMEIERRLQEKASFTISTK